MSQTYEQTTLKSGICVQGVGLHSGEHSTVRIHSAEPNTGILFMLDGVVIPALADFVVNSKRCTCLGNLGARVETVEHLMAALRGMNVDNAIIEVKGCELPILDGSALPWAEAIASTGVSMTGLWSDYALLTSPVTLNEGGARFVASPADRAEYVSVTSYNHPMLKDDVAAITMDAETFFREVAPARTYGFIEEIEALQSAGLAKGGSAENALVIYQNGFSSPLRMSQEWTKHKLLDLIGDLALAGPRRLMHLTAIASGHSSNVAFARHLRLL